MARGLATLVLALSTVVAMSPTPGITAQPQNDLTGARGGGDVFDLGVSLSVSRKVVPFGGTLREVLRVTNRGTVGFPSPEHPKPLSFGQEINIPRDPHYPGKAVYAYARSPGGHCSHGTYGPTSKIQTFACDVTPLAPGETQTVQVKIKNIKGNLLLDAGGFGGTSGPTYDDGRANDDAQAIIRVRRR